MAFSDLPLDWQRLEREDAYGGHLFRQLFRSVVLSLCGILHQPPNDLMDDCVQEAFLTAFRTRPPLTNTAELRAWLVRAAHRKYLDRQRSETRHRKHVLASWFSSSWLWKHKTAEADPAYQAEQVELCDKLVDVISQLKEHDRKLLHLLSAETLTYAQIAAALSVPVPQVPVLIHRARERLRKLLGGRPDDAK